MRVGHSLDRLHIGFDDPRPVAGAGLFLPVTLASGLGLAELFDARVYLGTALGRTHVGRKALSVIAALLAGGDCVEAADALRAGGSAGCTCLPPGPGPKPSWPPWPACALPPASQDPADACPSPAAAPPHPPPLFQTRIPAHATPPPPKSMESEQRESATACPELAEGVRGS